MTEAEWLRCEKPEAMLEGLSSPPERKLRLFALACCARIDHLINDPRSREAIAFATKYVETPATRQRGRATRAKAAHAAWKEAYAHSFTVPAEQRSQSMVVSCAVDAAAALLHAEPTRTATYAAAFATFAVGWGMMGPGDGLTDEAKAPEERQQAHLLRCILVNPFRPVAVDPSWLTFDVVSLARGVYDERAFDRLPILADALQDAGCENADVLAHCRDAGPHARGCWVVDLLLGKQ